VTKIVISLDVNEVQALAEAVAEGMDTAHETFSRRRKHALAAALRTAYKAVKRAEADAIAALTGK
jgi:hypothetical protein